MQHSPDQSQVTVRLGRDEGAGGAGDLIRLSVADQGPGVAADIQADLFEKFSRTGPHGKAGLGLYFCRLMVERWGGTIGYTSRPEGGACFWFCLPQPEQPTPPAKP